MIELKKILVGTDFSPHASVALRHAAGLAKAFNSELILLNVVEPADMMTQLPPIGESYFSPALIQAQEDYARQQGEEALKSIGHSPARFVLRQGSPFFEIIAAAKEEDVDLIVIGTHGRGAIAHMLMGSVAERVVRKAGCPVLVVREGDHEFVHP